MLQPPGPHEPPDGMDCGRFPPPPKAKADIFRLVFFSPHSGHSASQSDEELTISSNSFPHLSHLYS
jgi:hypothetical protein